LARWWRRLLPGDVVARWQVVLGGRRLILGIHRKSLRLSVDGETVAEAARERSGRPVTLRATLRGGRLVPTPLEIEASAVELDGAFHGVVRHRGVVLAGAPLPRPQRELDELIRSARQRCQLFEEAGVQTSEAEALRNALDGAIALPRLLDDTADLEVWVRANRG